MHMPREVREDVARRARNGELGPAIPTQLFLAFLVSLSCCCLYFTDLGLDTVPIDDVVGVESGVSVSIFQLASLRVFMAMIA